MRDFAKLMGSMVLVPFAMGGLSFFLAVERFTKAYGHWVIYPSLATLLVPIAGMAKGPLWGLLGIGLWLMFWIWIATA